MNPLSKLIAWATGQDFTYDRTSAPRTKYVTTRHPTKKGPGRSRGRDAMSAAKKVAVRNGVTLTKMPKHIPSGMDTGIAVNGIRGAKGGGRDAGGATTTLCKRRIRKAQYAAHIQAARRRSEAARRLSEAGGR